MMRVARLPYAGAAVAANATDVAHINRTNGMLSPSAQIALPLMASELMRHVACCMSALWQLVASITITIEVS